MTTKKFSALNLPIPRCSLELGCFDLNQGNLNYLPNWIPRISDCAQVIEVRKTGSTLPNKFSPLEDDYLSGSYIVIENARPELFLRRDFIIKFVDTGTVYLANCCSSTNNDDDDNDSAPPPTNATILPQQDAANNSDEMVSMGNYEIITRNNVLSLTLTEKQYRRFGLIGKIKVDQNCSKRTKKGVLKRYQVDVDLKDDKIKNSNKFQEKLIQTFKRLEPLSRVYFRYVYDPNKSKLILPPSRSSDDIDNNTNANKKSVVLTTIDDCLSFFKYVINEYAMDGFKPVPLTGCSMCQPKLDRHWLNCSQLHPQLDLLGSILRPSRRPKPATKAAVKSIAVMAAIKQPAAAASATVAVKRANKGKKQRNKGKVGAVANQVTGIAGTNDDYDDGNCKDSKDDSNSSEATVAAAIELVQKDSDSLGKLIDIVNWLGYQLLSLDCDREEINSGYPNDQERLDVACAQVCSVMDFELIHDNLRKIFKMSAEQLQEKQLTTIDDGCSHIRNNATTTPTDCMSSRGVPDSESHVVLRALVLYSSSNQAVDNGDSVAPGYNNNNKINQSMVVLLQDCTATAKAILADPRLEEQPQKLIVTIKLE